MRILFANLAIDWGGGERWTLTAARGLAGRGHDVSVAGRAGNELIERARLAGLRTSTLPVSVDYAPATIIAAWRLLRRRRPDVVVVHQNKDLRTVAPAARLAGAAVVHRNGFPILRNTPGHRFASRFAHRILTNSQQIKDRYVAYGWMHPERIDVVPNGVEPAVAAPRESLRSSWGAGPTDLVAVYAGRLTATKRAGDLLEAVAALPASTRWRLVILGSGSQETLLRERASSADLKNRVHFAGFRPEAAREIGGADLAVLPSSQEGMPNALMEAMAAGVPVAGTPVGDVRLLLDEGKAGWLVPVDDVPAWTRLLTELEAQASQLAVMGARGQRRVREEFTVERMLDGTEACLRRAIGQASGREPA